MKNHVLEPCPFCGSKAKSDNGFAPLESITYAYCSNNECRLHSVDIGFSIEEWNTRAVRLGQRLQVTTFKQR